MDASASHVFVATKQGLTVLPRSPQGFDKTPVGSLSLASGDTLKSLDYSEGYLALLGQSVYLVDVTNPTTPKLLDQKPVPGYPYYRDVALSEKLDQTALPWCTTQSCGAAGFMVFSYTTLKEYGQGTILLQGGVLGLPSAQILYVQELYDVDSDSNGKAKLYQVAIRQNLAKVMASGGVSRVGALDNYGLVYEWLEVTP